MQKIAPIRCLTPLQSLLEDASDWVQRMALNGRLHYVNAAWQQALGYADWSRRSGFDMVPGRSRLALQSTLRQVYATQAPAELQTTLITHEGRELAVWGKIVYEPTATPEPEFWILWRCLPPAEPPLLPAPAAMTAEALPECAQHKFIQDELTDEHRRLALDLTHIGSWDWHLPTQELIWNDNYYHILGYAPGTILSPDQLWRDSLHPDDADRTEQALWAALQNHTDLDVEYRIRHADDRWRWVVSRGRGIYNAQDQPVRMVGVLIDISDRKYAELALQQREEQLRIALDAANMGTWVWDLETNEEIWSEALERIFGFAPGEYDGKLETFYSRVHPDDLALVQATDYKTLTQGGMHSNEYRIVLPDGTIRWYMGRGQVYANAAGKPQRVLGVGLDVTELKRGVEESRKALLKERELSELKSRFVSMVSHEIRTPLTTIMTSADVLQNIPCQEPERQELFSLIQSSIGRMTQLLENSLSIGVTASGSLAFQPETFDLRAFCGNVLQGFEHSMGWQHHLQLEWAVDRPLDQDGACWVELDPKLLLQILNNLLGNAIKYSALGSTVILRVTDLRWADWPGADWPGADWPGGGGGDRLQFQVQDQGIGIPPEDIPHLFDCFYRAPNVETVDGTGLGLSIVKHCLECHGGSIAVTSELGCGTLFTVTLPLAALPPD